MVYLGPLSGPPPPPRLRRASVYRERPSVPIDFDDLNELARAMRDLSEERTFDARAAFRWEDDGGSIAS